MPNGFRFLRFIIIYKALMGSVEMLLAGTFLSFYDLENSDASFTAIASNLNLDPDNRLIHAAITNAGHLDSGTVLGIAAVVVCIGALNNVEAVGLYYRQRWAEWLTVVATGVFIPFELYEVLRSVSLLKIVILVINIAIVYYLGKHKELFGKRGRRKRAEI